MFYLASLYSFRSFISDMLSIKGWTRAVTNYSCHRVENITFKSYPYYIINIKTDAKM